MLAEIPDVELVALIDVNFSCTKVNGLPALNSIPTFLDSGIHCHIFIVATPNGLHAEHAAACLKAGKHVLVEKPVAFTLAEVEHLIELARKHNRQIIPVWQIRYSPLIAALKRLTVTGALGEIHSLQADCFWNRDEQYYQNHPWHGTLDMDGGPLYTQFSHVIDILCWLNEGISVTDAFFFKERTDGYTEFEDSGVVNFMLAGQGTGKLNYNISAPEGTFTNELAIVCSGTKIKLSGKYFENIVELKTEDAEIKGVLGGPVLSVKDDIGRYCMRRLLEDVIDKIRVGRKSEGFSDVRNATGIIEKAYSLARGRFDGWDDVTTLLPSSLRRQRS